MKSQSTASCFISLEYSSSSPWALHTCHVQLKLQWCQRHWAALYSQSFRDISQWERASVCKGELLPRKLWIITCRLPSLSRFYETGCSHKPDRSLCTGKKKQLCRSEELMDAFILTRPHQSFGNSIEKCLLWLKMTAAPVYIKLHQKPLSWKFECCTVGFEASEQKDNRLLQFNDFRKLLRTQACGSCMGVSLTQNALFWFGLEFGRIRWLWECSSRLTPRGQEPTGSAN